MPLLTSDNTPPRVQQWDLIISEIKLKLLMEFSVHYQLCLNNRIAHTQELYYSQVDRFETTHMGFPILLLSSLITPVFLPQI